MHGLRVGLARRGGRPRLPGRRHPRDGGAPTPLFLLAEKGACCQMFPTVLVGCSATRDGLSRTVPHGTYVATQLCLGRPRAPAPASNTRRLPRLLIAPTALYPHDASLPSPVAPHSFRPVPPSLSRLRLCPRSPPSFPRARRLSSLHRCAEASTPNLAVLSVLRLAFLTTGPSLPPVRQVSSYCEVGKTMESGLNGRRNGESELVKP